MKEKKCESIPCEASIGEPQSYEDWLKQHGGVKEEEGEAS